MLRGLSLVVIIAGMTKLGILGGGQLAQMTIQAAISLGIETVIFERKPDSPASRLTHHNVVGAWDDDAALREFIALCDIVTLENEFVDASVLQKIQDAGVPVYPTASTLAKIQDKLVQKATMRDAGVPVPDFQDVKTPDDVLKAGDVFGYPMLLKARREGYDGYGNVTLNSADEVVAGWQKLGADKGRELLVEKFVPFERELAVMVLRGRDGAVKLYPVVETVQQNHICHVVRAPADIPSDSAQIAAQMARKAVEAVDGVGVFGVEMFKLKDGTILYNEMAPRPHNSGHYTIEGCVTSQFENHIHAVLGWALGQTAMIAPAAVMVNILGNRLGDAHDDAVRQALTIPGAHVHLYSKREVRPGRKMGHVTVLGDSVDHAETLARQAVDLIDL